MELNNGIHYPLITVPKDALYFHHSVLSEILTT